MRRSLKVKMILSYLAVALLTVLVVSALIRLMFSRSLMSLVVEEQTAQLTEAVQEYYTANGTLEGFFDSFIQADRSRPPHPDESAPANPASAPESGAPEAGAPESGAPNPYWGRRDVRGVHGLVDAQYRAVLPTLGYAIGETVPQEAIQQKVAVAVDGQTVAWILPDNTFQFTLSPEEQLFLHRATLAIAWAAATGVLAAVVIGFFLANRLLKPIRLLTRASQALARGNLEQQVPVTSQDELGQLTTTFNQMSGDLARADQQRKRMTADITHDLSTPLQIISGYIEMLEDGSVSLTPQRLEIIKTEVGHLRRLVGDLSTLTQVEAGGLDITLQLVQPGKLLEHIYEAYQPIAARQGVTLAVDVPENCPEILVDEGRMVQVLKNLLENALRYTPEGGTIRLSACSTDRVQLQVKDSGQGIDPEDLPYVFDRFYQADKARGANSGKMGLGLAICKALVAVQGGSIRAESAGKGQGTTMVISLDPGSH